MAQEVGVRNVQDLKQFGNDLKRLSEQLSGAFHVAEKKMNKVNKFLYKKYYNIMN